MRRKELIVSNRLLKGFLWSFVATLLPFTVAIISIPILIDGIGVDRFGILAICWMIVGYFSLFDFGIGKALTIQVAAKLGEENVSSIPEIVSTALVLMLILGFFCLTVVAYSTPWIVEKGLSIPYELQYESIKSFYLLALSIPIVILTVGLRGVISAYQRFDLIAIIRVPMGILTFAGPVAVLPFSKSLYPIVVILVAGRLLSLIAHMYFVFKILPSLKIKNNSALFQVRLIKSILVSGGWVTVSNLLVPIMVSMDRFLIGSVLSIAAVAYYATSYEIVSRILVIPTSLVAVFLPAITTAISGVCIASRKEAAIIYSRSSLYGIILLFPLLLIISTFSPEILLIWVGEEFSTAGHRVMRWLSVGVLFYGASLLPMSLLQGGGRPDLAAKAHLIELPIYLIGLWWAVVNFGILGVAITWVLRASIDFVLLFELSKRVLPESKHLLNNYYLIIAIMMILFLISVNIPTTEYKIFFVFIVMALSIYYSVVKSIWVDERRWIVNSIIIQKNKFRSILSGYGSTK